MSSSVAAPRARVPRVLIVAGSDSGGGAGVQADIKTCAAVGAFATTALTALTAQDTTGVHGVHGVPPAFVADQMRAVLGDIGVHVVKTGMLANNGVIEAVEGALRALETAGDSAATQQQPTDADASLPTLPLLVVDPVMVSASGHALLDAGAVAALGSRLLPRALLVTPNLPEASALLGGAPVETPDQMRAAAREICARYRCRAVLLKGGHLGGERSDRVTDILFDSATGEWAEASSPRIPTRNSHGTGCTLASAIAAFLARGLVEATAPPPSPVVVAGVKRGTDCAPVAARQQQRSINDYTLLAPETGALLRVAVAQARAFLQALLAASVPVSLGRGGHGPMNHSFAVDDYVGGGSSGSKAAPLPLDLRLYAVTDPRMNAAHGRSLVDAVAAAIAGGATVVQLREKGADTGEFVAAATSVMAAVKRLRSEGAPGGRVAVIINDRLDVCQAADADGVHLGQSDMPPAVARALLGAGKLIGVSADTPADAAAAEAAGADYLGVGTVFPTSTKADAGDAIGVAGLAAVAASTRLSVVAIGGINARNAASVLTGAAAACAGGGGATSDGRSVVGGVRGVAVVSALFDAPDVTAAAAGMRAIVDAALSARRGDGASDASTAAGAK
jgi:hydroxymethylpyrimidine kinase / phosphomethylpyrimidine kinase / thiamine-phosphate diphosphorylase